MTQRIVVFGAGGQVAAALLRLAPPPGFALCGVTRADADITRADRVRAILAEPGVAIAVNAAAFTDVDGAERTPDAAFAANRDGPAVLAELCAGRGIPLIHLSSDYVFDGAKPGPYVEDDPVSPLGVYGVSKAAGEAAVRDRLAAHVILRTSWVFSAEGRNFVRTMLLVARERDEVRVVDDQIGCPTPAGDVAAAVLAIAARLSTRPPAAPWGTFHFCAAGAVSWRGFATAIFAEARAVGGLRAPKVTAITTADWPTPARRPANSVLDCSKIGAVYGIGQRPWRDGLVQVVTELGQPARAVAS